MNWDYLQPVKIHFGKGRVKEIKEIARELGCERGLLVAGPFFFKSGLAEKVIKESEGMIVASFGDVSPNPDVVEVDACAEVIRQKNIGFVVALGGGSPMDCAKAAASVALTSDSIRKYHGTGVAMPEKHLPLIAVPTTAGTGSETTLAAVITDAETRHKYAINDFPLIPRYAVLDPKVTLSLPPFITATTGMDALTHAIEGYTTKAAWEMTDMFHLKAIEIISRSLRSAVANEKEGREGMALGQYIAGMGFSNVGLGIAHSMAHTLGAVYDTPHGVACAMMLPIVMEYNADCTGEKYREIARAMGVKGVDEMSVEEYRKAAVDAVRKLSVDVGIPTKLEALKEEDLQFLAESAHADACAPGNPKDASVEDLKDLFRKLM